MTGNGNDLQISSSDIPESRIEDTGSVGRDMSVVAKVDSLVDVDFSKLTRRDLVFLARDETTSGDILLKLLEFSYGKYNRLLGLIASNSNTPVEGLDMLSRYSSEELDAIAMILFNLSINNRVTTIILSNILNRDSGLIGEETAIKIAKHPNLSGNELLIRLAQLQYSFSRTSGGNGEIAEELLKRDDTPMDALYYICKIHKFRAIAEAHKNWDKNRYNELFFGS